MTLAIEDVIDLEYYIHQDENASSGSAAGSAAAGHDQRQRDRDIYLQHVQPLLARQRPSSPFLFTLKAYLEQRREQEAVLQASPALLPGRVFGESYRLLRWAAVLGAGLVALFGTLAFLNYSGAQPLNVGLFVALFVLPQVFVLVLFLMMGAVGVLRPRLRNRSLLAALAGAALIRVANKLHRAARTRLSARQRLSLEAAVGLLKGHHSQYGSLFFWPLFNLVQWLGIGFNLGIISATLFKLLSADLAFGWQSTFQISSQGVYQLLQILAIPWSWLLSEPLAHPTLAQIEGSRMILKDGIYHLRTADLVSWWPFLCLMVLVYGLLPRLGLLAAGKLIIRRLLKRLASTHGSWQRLVQRLQTPLVHTRGGRVSSSQMSDPPAETQNLAPPFVANPSHQVIALVSDELFGQLSSEEIAAISTINPVLAADRVLAVTEDEATIPQLTAQGLSADVLANAHLLVLQEAWQPPIRQSLDFLANLRRNLGTSIPISVGLLGKPASDTLLTPATPEQRRIWQQKLKGLGDPNLSVLSLVPDA